MVNVTRDGYMKRATLTAIEAANSITLNELWPSQARVASLPTMMCACAEISNGRAAAMICCVV
jgi:hypothetical protein